ncbi:tetratricopeptide repeat protein [Ramlibacter sp.]|uniref:tetratricopeptide repeat protein n=1 Tax=Ramlibacter sp. TaxID=1917967 RepID=UPI003D0CC3D0
MSNPPPTIEAALEAYNAGRRDVAAALCERMIERDPSSFNALHLLGTVRLENDQLQEAFDLLSRACAIEAGVAIAHLRRGVAARRLGQLAVAREAYATAVRLSPTFAKAWNGLGITLAALGEHEEALGALDRALALEPDDARTNWNASLVRLALGDYARGWAQYEWRLQVPEFRFVNDLPSRPWRGQEDLRGKSIVLIAEQGLGDTIQFCRYAPLVVQYGARVVLRVPAPLVKLLRTLHPAIEVVDASAPWPATDFHCPLMSLPLAFRTLLQTIPSQPYLHADASDVDVWSRRMGERASPLRVGLAWAGASPPRTMREEFETSLRRSLRLRMFEAFGAIPGVEFFSLQVGDAAAEIGELARDPEWYGPRLRDMTSDIHDFADTAALVANLDLVITCDTSVAHLAGALGRPVWVLSRFDACWRWLVARSDSPWYPSARVFRQPRLGEWAPPVAEAAEALRAIAS